MLPEGLFVKPVEGTDDTVAFNFPFELEVKALPDGTAAGVAELEDGDLLIEGWAADFDGIDRQGENFVEGAFERGIKAFLTGTASLNYHHKHDMVLGKVLELAERVTPERRGLWMRARVDGAIKNHPVLGTIYHQIRRGTLKGLSVGGFFKRVMTPAGYRIGDTDFTEISVTNVPVHARPSFAVVAGKALESLDTKPPAAAATVEVPEGTLDDLQAALDNLSAAFEGKALPVTHDPEAASHVALLLKHVQDGRNMATGMLGYAENRRVREILDRIETQHAMWEQELHRIAAQVGPLPPPPITH